ncbi:MAG: DNA internalization-related competence protein ComEC/Rec2 [Gammaproteobacteria bacterium]|nr:DNA internalization-related competence protein ComEC/Rec2 [Gammaproteobacteria bacterium]
MLVIFVPGILLGMILNLILPRLPNTFELVCLCGLILSLLIRSTSHGKLLLQWMPSIFCFTVKTDKQGVKACLNFSLAFLIGFTWFALNAQWLLNKQLPKKFENIPIIVQGKISSLPIIKNGALQFQFDLQQIGNENQLQSLNLTTLLNWKEQDNISNELHIGERWQFQVKLKRPHSYANLGSFDYEAWLFQANIRAAGFVISSSATQAENLNKKLASANSFGSRIAYIREYYNHLILTNLINRPFAGVIAALTVGNSSSITQAQWQVFRNTGTSHLIAISGLHIGMIAALFYFLGGRVWRFSAILCERLPSQKAGALWAMIGAFLYTAFSGFSIPADRTLIMIIAWMSSQLLSRYNLPRQRFMLGLGAIIILDPFSVMNSGFWLSFSAIALIAYGMSRRLAMNSVWWRFGRVQWVATLGLMPLTWLLFQQSSLVGLFANFIAIPWVSWVTVPTALFACILLPFSAHAAQMVLILAEKTLEWLWPYLNYLANSHWNSWFLGFYTPWLVLPTFIAVLLALAPLQWPARWLGLIWFLPALLARPEKLPPQAVKLTVLDVGQGLSVIIQTQNHTLIYDTGMGYPDGYNMGDVVLLPFFRAVHIHHVDQLIISHGDADHAGGAVALVREFPQLPILTSAIAKFKQAQFCHAGQTWQLDGVEFKILYPFEGQLAADNNNSCVLEIVAGSKKAILPGDIEETAEKTLVEHYPGQLGADVLIAAHHGSQTSSTPDFIAAINPKIVIFSTGYLNRYHFPSPKVVSRYTAEGSLLYNTSTDGAVTIVFNQGLKVHAYRSDARHFWDEN